MKSKKRILFLAGALAFSSLYQASIDVYAASPEEECFTELIKAAKNNPAFNDIDFKAVKKIGGKNNQYESEPFSVETYEDFLKAFETPVPYSSADLKFYPNNMGRVGGRYKFNPRVHKANRNNSSIIIYNDGTKTDIDHWMSTDGTSTENDIRKYFSGRVNESRLNKKYTRQTIDGYYIDSRYVTFGRETDLDFAFPTRAANPADDRYYPGGRPVRDVREYLMYTHHLSPKYGGDFLSCELNKTVPQSPYVLKDYDGEGNGLRWENFGGTRLSASNAVTEIVKSNKFRKSEIEYSNTVKTDPESDLLRFYTLAIYYNNHNSFLNSFRTSQMMYEAMLDAKNLGENFLTMRRAFYDKVIASDLEIGGNIDPSEPPSEPPSSEIPTDYGMRRNNPVGQLAVPGKVEFFLPTEATANYMCQQLGEDRGQWTGNSGTPTLIGWAPYPNIAIVGWSEAGKVVACNTGLQCFANQVSFGRNLRCWKTQ